MKQLQLTPEQQAAVDNAVAMYDDNQGSERVGVLYLNSSSIFSV